MGFEIEITGVATPRKGQQRLRQLAALDLVVAERALQ
jgi:hypothetical protein